jgi:outer membrane protein OmpA-like peptidoglycan-associated protein
MKLLLGTLFLIVFSFSANAQNTKVTGIVDAVTDKTFVIVSDENQLPYVVVFDDKTKFAENKKNFLRKRNVFKFSNLTKGLPVLVKGYALPNYTLRAEAVYIRVFDLVNANRLNHRLAPIEETQEVHDKRLDYADANATKLAGQIQELNEISKAADSRLEAVENKAAEVGKGLADISARVEKIDSLSLKYSLDLFFPRGQYLLTPEHFLELAEFLQQFKSEKYYIFEIKGFASFDGDTLANRKLSEKRAKTVETVLVEQLDVPLHSVTVHGFGAYGDGKDARKVSILGYVKE